MGFFLIRKECFSLFDRFGKQLQRNVAAPITIATHIVPLNSLQDVVKVLGIWAVLLLLKLEVKRLTSFLQEVRQLLNF